MKRYIFILLLILALVLSACSGTETVPETVYTVERDGMTFTVNTPERTITHDGDVYSYKAVPGNDGTEYTIFYPDGAEYHMVCQENLRYGSWNGSYDTSRHLDGDILIDILQEKAPQKQQSPEEDGFAPIAGLAFIFLGILDLVFPYAEWFSSRGWYYKDAEPSDIALNVIRAGGVLLLILGVIVLIGSFVM